MMLGFRGYPVYYIVEAVEAVELLESLRLSGRSVTDYINQLNGYYDAIVAAGHPDQGNLFGAAVPTLEEITGANRYARPEANQPEGARRPGPGVERPPAPAEAQVSADSGFSGAEPQAAGADSGAEADLLTSYSEQDIAQREADQAEAERNNAAAQRAAEQKAQADSEALDFTLSGSDRPADIAESRGQNSLFDTGGEPAPQNNEPAQTPANAGVSLFSASDFIESPDGGINYGEITADMAKAAGRQAGKIRLERGNEKYGLIHIDQRHGKQIKALGYTDIKDFILDAVKAPDFVWRPSKTAQLEIIDNIGKGKAVFVEMKAARDESGDYYTVNTAFPITSPDYENRKKGWRLLWSRETGPAAPAVADASFAEPDQSKDGDRATMSQGQSKNSVADIGEDSQPIRNSAGNPFKNMGAARIALKKNPGYEIAEVDGGYELRPIPEGAATAANGNMAEPPRTGALEVNDDLAGDIDAAANEAATSPLNDKPEPTVAQIEAGNYEKGHVTVHGLDIAIENPRGSQRSGTDPDGKEPVNKSV